MMFHPDISRRPNAEIDHFFVENEEPRDRDARLARMNSRRAQLLQNNEWIDGEPEGMLAPHHQEWVMPPHWVIPTQEDTDEEIEEEEIEEEEISIEQHDLEAQVIEPHDIEVEMIEQPKLEAQVVIEQHDLEAQAIEQSENEAVSAMNIDEIISDHSSDENCAEQMVSQSDNEPGTVEPNESNTENVTA